MNNIDYVAKEISTDDDTRTITAVINTAAIDRAREIVLPKGGNFDAYMKNPVVIYAHDYSSKPWGKVKYIDRKRKQIVAKIEAAKTEQGEELYQLYKGGFLNAFSIGFQPKKGASPTPDEIKKNPEWAEANFVFSEWEMLELSGCPVPCNPEALATAIKSKAIELSDSTIKTLGLEIEVEDEQKSEPEPTEKEEADNKRDIYCNKDVDIAEIINTDGFTSTIGLKDIYTSFTLVEAGIKEGDKFIDVLYGVDGKTLTPVMYIYNGWDEKLVKSYCEAENMTYDKKQVAIEKKALATIEVIKSSDMVEIELTNNKMVEIEPMIEIKTEPMITIEDTVAEAVKIQLGQVY